MRHGMSLNVYFVCVGNRPHARHVASSFKQYVDCNVVQITDDKTPELPGIDRVIRRTYPGHMMLMMIESFAEIQDPVFITTADDCIINDRFDDVIGMDYDVAICRRTVKKMDHLGAVNITEHLPWTNGLVVVKHPEFYKDCLAMLTAMGKHLIEILDWWGDMLSIREVLNTGKYRALELPEDRFCRIPVRKGEGDSSAVLWHYSGNKRKWWMNYHGQGVAV